MVLTFERSEMAEPARDSVLTFGKISNRDVLRQGEMDVRKSLVIRGMKGVIEENWVVSQKVSNVNSMLGDVVR